MTLSVARKTLSQKKKQRKEKRKKENPLCGYASVHGCLYISHLYTEQLHASKDTILITKVSYYVYQSSLKSLGSSDPSA